MGEMERTWMAGRIISLRGLFEEKMGKEDVLVDFEGGGDRECSRVRKRVECLRAFPGDR